MCVSCRQEIAHHIFFRYRYTTVVWREVARRKGREVMTIGNSVHQTWNKSWDKIRQGDAMPRKEWATLFMCIMWSLWKKMNKKVFSNKIKPPSVYNKYWKKCNFGGIARGQLGCYVQFMHGVIIGSLYQYIFL